MGGKTENSASQRCGAFYIGFSKKPPRGGGFSFGADGGTLNPHLALRFAPRELVKQPSAPAGRYRRESFLLFCGLKRFLISTIISKTKPTLMGGFCFGADGGTLSPAEQARQQAALRSRWSLQTGILLVILRLEAISRTQQSFPTEKPTSWRWVFLLELMAGLEPATC